MPSKRAFEREAAFDALAGKTPGQELIHRGLMAWQGIRQAGWRNGVQGRLSEDKSVRSTNAKWPVAKITVKRKLVRAAQTTLDHGAKFELYFDENGPLGAIRLRTGRLVASQAPAELARLLAERANGDAEILVGICATIERARKRVFQLMEEATRWL